MIRLQTPVTDVKCRVPVSYRDRILMLGSCFSDNVGQKLSDYGFDVCINPFGTLYNPASISQSVERLVSGTHFTEEECVWMGSGAGRVCSFWHHTSFARNDIAEFLENANRRLDEACSFFRDCSKIIITLGTAWCFRYTGWEASGSGDSAAGGDSTDIPPAGYTGRIVSNCLKRDAREFSRERMTLETAYGLLENIVKLCKAESTTDFREKQIIFTVSPIRHLADGAHGNQLSKSTLLMAADMIIEKTVSTDYFPAYEIMMDELRDYRFYAEDMVHPSLQAVDYISERFLDWALPASERPILEENIRRYRQSRHRDRG